MTTSFLTPGSSDLRQHGDVHVRAQDLRRGRGQFIERVAGEALLPLRGPFEVDATRGTDLSLEVERGEDGVDQVADGAVVVDRQARGRHRLLSLDRKSVV